MSETNNIAVFITSTGWGGLEMNTVKLSGLLKNEGFSLTLFTQEDSSIVSQKNDAFHRIEIVQKPRKYFDYKTARDIARRLKNNNIQVVFVVDNKDLDVLTWTKRLFYKELKIVYQQHMQIGINKKDFFHTYRYKSINTWISPLPFLKVEIGLRTHFPLNRVEVVPIGLETSKFLNPTYTKKEARELLNIKTDLPLLGIIGRISEKKGQRFVAEALLALKNDGSHAKLLIFGSATINDEADKKYDKELREFVQKNDLSRLVHFIDYQKDVHKFYNAIDVFILASHSETYGMVTIEAMLSGIPVIGTNSGGTPEILANGKLGHLYPHGNQEKFIKELRSVLNEMEITRQMTKNAKESAAVFYDQKSELEAITNILKRYL